MRNNLFLKLVLFQLSLVKSALWLVFCLIHILLGGDPGLVSRSPEKREAAYRRAAARQRQEREAEAAEAAQAGQIWVSADDDDEDERARKRRRSDDFIAHPNPLSNHHQVHISMSHDHHLDSSGMSSSGMSSGGMGGMGMF